MSISLSELNQALPSYNVIRKIGEGGSRESFLAYKENTHIPVVLKVFKTINIHERIESQRKKHSLTDILSRELELIRYLSHPNIVRYYTHGSVFDTFYLEEEYMAGGSVLTNNHNINEKKGITLFMQLLSGVQFCHEKGFILRDIKMDNTLLNEDYSTIKISDLELAGNAREILETRTIGSRKYSAPELEQQNNIPNIQTDIYSLGCWLYYILTKEKDTIQNINGLRVNKYNKALNELLAKTPERYRETLIGCLSFDPEKRFRCVTEVQNSLFDLNPIVMTVFQKDNMESSVTTYYDNPTSREKVKDAEETDFYSIGEICRDFFKTHNIFTKPEGIVAAYIIDSHFIYKKKGG
jgi:serine/threonine protein kinase